MICFLKSTVCFHSRIPPSCTLTLLPPEFLSDRDISSWQRKEMVLCTSVPSLHHPAAGKHTVIREIPLLSCRNNTGSDFCLLSLPAELRNIKCSGFEVPRNQRLLCFITIDQYICKDPTKTQTCLLLHCHPFTWVHRDLKQLCTSK